MCPLPGVFHCVWGVNWDSVATDYRVPPQHRPVRVSSAPQFTVAIPVFNEAAILRENVQRLSQFLASVGSYEILIGINGSTDESVEICERLSREDPCVRYFVIPERRVGLVFQRFLQEARSGLLVSVDMDLSIDMNFIPRSLRLLEQHDLVIGSKKLGTENRSLLRRFGSDLYIWTVRALYSMNSHDYSLAAKAYRVAFFRPFAAQLSDHTNYVVDCVYLAKWHGGRSTEIPVVCEDHRPSRFNLRREAWEKYSYLFKLWYRHRKSEQVVTGATPAVSRLKRASSGTR
jgi:glycosyltransferase involved in cell wall biosynthesis